MNIQNECCVCFEDQKGNITIILPCRHEMCISCMMSVMPSVCPLCRKDYSYALNTFKDKITRLNIPNDAGISYTQTEFPNLPSRR